MKELSGKQRATYKEYLRSAIEVVGLFGAPNRRSQGLELIGKAVSLDPEPQQRTEFRDLAAKFLVLREIEESKPGLATGKSNGLVFTPAGDRLAILSEDDSELMVWDVARRRRLSKMSLRGGPGTWPQAMTEPAVVEITSSNTSDAAGSGTASVSPGPRSGPAAQFGRPNTQWRPQQRLAQIGPYLAMVLPDDKGLGLLDLLSGSPLRVLERPEHTIVGVLGEPSGRRLVTIEHVAADADTQKLVAQMFGPDVPPPGEFHVYLWDVDNLVQPIATLRWRVGPPARWWDAFPLVAISPDGKTVAVASNGGRLVKLYSARDGKPLKRTSRFGPGQTKDSSAKDLEIDPQAELTALALGPHNSLAMAGNTPGGVAIRIWNLDSPSSQTSLNNSAQSITRMMRFSPHGNLLAIVGSGPIELWDPVALNRVAVLVMSDQAQSTDVAFAPDGKTLAAVSQAGTSTLWTIHDSEARTQLSGFESSAMSLAFGDEGLLAGVGWNGELWFWRSGRCPEIGPPSPFSPGSASVNSIADVEPKRSEAPRIEGQRSKSASRDREGPRPPRRGPSPSLAFDESGRLVLHDPQGLRIYNSGSIPAENPPAFRISAPPVPGGWFGGIPETARTPDGKIMAIVRSTNIYLWNAQSPAELISVDLPARSGAEPARNVARRKGPGVSEPSVPVFLAIQIAPDGRRIYTVDVVPGASSVLRAWELDASSGATAVRARELESVSLPDGRINFVLGVDGKRLAVADRTGQVTILDASTLVSLGRLKGPGKEPDGPRPPAIAFSPDGTELAVGSERGAISLWSVARPARPQLRLQLPGHPKLVNRLAYEPNGRRLASATPDSIVEVWDLDIIDRELVRLKLAD